MSGSREFLVKEDGQWRTVGGHRDGVCSLDDDTIREHERVCRD